MSAPCTPTDNKNLWTVHVLVEGNHPRNSGMFVINYNLVSKL